MARLKVIVAEKVLRSHALGERTAIGRHPTADVVLPDPSVSRAHAVIVREGDSYVIQDLGSGNGVLVNLKKVSREVLGGGDLIKIGNSLLVFSEEDEPAPPERVVEIRAPGDVAAVVAAPARPDDIVLRLTATREVVEAVQDAMPALLAGSCLDEAGLLALDYAAAEALSNAFRHGSGGDPGKRIEARLVREPHQVALRVRDEGPGFDFRAKLEVARRGDVIGITRERGAGRPGGLGILIIVRCVDLVEFNDKGNEIVLCRYAPDLFGKPTLAGQLGFTRAEGPPLEGTARRGA
ncbi:MAG: ATP-binding protein [Planctomycetales bacterium]|nr:ATP-binding protein [Planctomycetales bacterium]